MMHRLLAYLAALAAVVLLAAPGVASAATSEGAVVSNGVVQLGITKWGDLNYDCNGNGDGGCPANSAAGGTPNVGIRFVPLNTDATADGCPCEGWGAADAASGLAGYANQSAGNGNVTPVSVVATPTTAVVTTDIGDGALPGFELRVVHDYHPSPVSPNLYEATVRITNIGTENVADLRYRRVMDWDIEPTPYNEWVTIANTGASRQLLFDSDGGFASSNPLDPNGVYQQSESVCGAGYTGLCEFSNLGAGGVYPDQTQPADHGALFDFGFGALAPGQTRIFQTYYGAAPSREVALSAIAAQGIGVYSLGEPDCGANGNFGDLCSDLGAFDGVGAGLPNTFTFGFLTNDVDLSTTGGATPAAVQTGQQATGSFTVTNTGPDGAPNATLTIPLPEGVGYVAAVPSQGSCTYSAPNVVCSLGALANGASATVSLTTTLSQAGSFQLVATVATPANDDAAANDTASLELRASHPPATVAAAPSAQPAAPNQAAVAQVAAPFMVQVQFRIPSTCAMPCKMRAQLLARTGKTKLGSRKLSIATAGQVRFFVPIDKSVLLASAGAVDAKGYRTALTRLVVWTRAANGRWTSTIKQGHISVAIRRLTSGGIPSVKDKVF